MHSPTLLYKHVILYYASVTLGEGDDDDDDDVVVDEWEAAKFSTLNHTTVYINLH